jgi:hypothetical protein
MSKGQTFLQKYIQRPLAGLVDAATLGYTDLDKKGDDIHQKRAKRAIAGFGDLVTRNQYDFDQKGTNAQVRAREINEFDKELAKGRGTLGDSYNRQQYNQDFRNMLLTDTALREYESARQAQRNKALARDFLEMTDVYAQTAADRRLMEDRSSPTKISQQILRARQGEAALMDAVARQGNTAVNIATAGLSPRGRAGGR